MNFTLSNLSDTEQENIIIHRLWEYNAETTPVDILPLRVTVKNDKEELIGGLIARTWWGGLEIEYLWVADGYRKMGIGKGLMQRAQEEAFARGCHMAYVDTFSFQALGFYQRLGFSQYGQLSEFAHQHTRHYLSRKLSLEEFS